VIGSDGREVQFVCVRCWLDLGAIACPAFDRPFVTDQHSSPIIKELGIG
jgi:hypothetical protein